MYDKIFFFVSWGVMYTLILPIVLFTIIGVIYEALAKPEEKAKSYTITEMLSILSDNKLEKPKVERILADFLEKYANFDDGKDIDSKLQFVYKLGLVESYDIEQANLLKDDLMLKNPKKKKEIEKEFSRAFKDREGK